MRCWALPSLISFAPICQFYMYKEEETGKQSKKWVYAVDAVREKLNAYREKKLPKDITTYEYNFFDPTYEPKKVF